MQLINSANYSYWELKQYFKLFDLIVIGSGIVGLSTAISFKEKHKKASVLVLERGTLPNGASTKNAGFACFGSAGELLDDLSRIPESAVWETVKMRWNGLQMLRKRLGDTAIDYQQLGGYELFKDQKNYDECLSNRHQLNKNIKSTLGLDNCFKSVKRNKVFDDVCGMFLNGYEGQIDTGLMMDALLLLAQKHGIKLLNTIHVTAINDLKNKVDILSDQGIFTAAKVVVATNGFASQLLKLNDVKPARAQVLITNEIKNLKIKGTFHYQQGYYYFRNINNRILLGGGRNLDFITETTTEQTLNPIIQTELDRLLKELILPGREYKIEHRWTGIMGVGKEKIPVIEQVSPNVLAAVRMGGMGIAIGSWVGKKAADGIDY